MPEGPEVRRMADQLNELLADKELTEVKLLSGRYVKHAGSFKGPWTPLPLTVDSVATTGKFMSWAFTDGSYLIASMGMTGRWTTSEDPHNRIEFTFSDGTKLFFNDIRNFGTIAFCDFEKVREKEGELGLDFLGVDGGVHDSFPAKFRCYCMQFKGPIGELLLDQSFLAGVGNYIRAEALYRAKLSPHRTIESLTEDEVEALREAVYHVMTESYKAGGSTILTYKDMNGEVGNYSSQFKVYGKKQDPDGNPVTREVDKAKRAIWWVPAVQK